MEIFVLPVARKSEVLLNVNFKKTILYSTIRGKKAFTISPSGVEHSSCYYEQFFYSHWSPTCRSSKFFWPVFRTSKSTVQYSSASILLRRRDWPILFVHNSSLHKSCLPYEYLRHTQFPTPSSKKQKMKPNLGFSRVNQSMRIIPT